MIHDRRPVPLSPPNSPRMSDVPAKASEYQWQQPAHLSSLSAQPATQPYQSFHPQGATPQQSGQRPEEAHNSNRPPLRSHKSFPYSLGPSSRLQHEVSQDSASGATLVEFRERVVSQGPQPVGTSELPPAPFGGSAPTSPAGRLTPNSPGAGAGDASIEDEDIDFGMAEPGEEDTDRPPMTAAELRAQKRKMKRFRLTHNQTRFLMSEFARQAHPDAAHRERLSREIPGLSPRQVQVWFQNRRAKLKRLTTDDRERMLRSRALPADFDMTQTLHSPFGATAPPPNVGTPMPSPGSYASFGESSSVRPLTLDTLRRVPSYEPYGQHFASPTGISPAMGAFAFTPPQSATETMSPASAAGNVPHFNYQPHESPRRPSHGFPLAPQTNYGAQYAHYPRFGLHDRLTRAVGDSAGSPLRTSMSYDALDASHVPQNQSAGRASSFSEQSSSMSDRPQQHRSLTGPTGNAGGPYGLGFTYTTSVPAFQPSEQQAQQQQSVPSVNTSQPMALQQYRRGSGHLAGPPITTYAQYQPPQFAIPQLPPSSGYGNHYASQAYHSSYSVQTQQHERQAQQQAAHQFQPQPVPSQPSNFVPLPSSNEQEGEEEDNSEGGVPLPPSY